MIAEKLQDSDLSNQLAERTTDSCVDTPESNPEEQGSDNQQSESEVSTSNQSKRATPAQSKNLCCNSSISMETQCAAAYELSIADDRKFDQMSGIENMWRSWKCDTYRKLKPVVQYSHQLKVYQWNIDAYILRYLFLPNHLPSRNLQVLL